MKGREEYILAIDQGTTGTTALLIDFGGNVVKKTYAECAQIYPKPGWVEHDPEEIWKVTLEVIKSLISESKSIGIEPKQISSIGLTNQRETTVIWSRISGVPIHNAIVWQCRRTADICQNLKERGLIEPVKSRTGLVIDPYFSATKISWILENVNGAREAAKSGALLFGTIDTWLLWKLTSGKVHATDYTNASRTMIFNINNLEWDPELLEELKIPKTVLPEVKPSAYVYGKTSDIGVLPDGIRISGIAGDQQAALFGQGCFEAGGAKNTYGTGCFLMLNTGENPVYSEHGLLTTLACGKGEKPVYALEGSVFIAGAAIQWLRDGLGLIKSAAETEALARSVKDSNGVYMVPAFVGLGAPYWDVEARGAIYGLTRGAKRQHIIRAALEAIAFQTSDVMRAMLEDSKIKLKELRVDGGAAANDFLMQFQADILNINVNRPKNVETTALGAGFLAGLGAQIWKDASELEKCRQVDIIFEAKMEQQQRERLLSGWRNAVERVRTK